MNSIGPYLEQAIQDTPIDQMPALIGMLAQLQAKAQLKMLSETGSREGPQEELLTIPQVAEQLKVSEYKAYELARQGTLKCIRLGKSVRVRRSAMSDYIRQHAT